MACGECFVSSYYLRDLPRCRGCSTRIAAVELVNSSNASLGVYCRGCGKRALKRKEAEAKVVAWDSDKEKDEGVS